MASPKVFISSTCYDLGVIREQLRSFLIGLGYEPIMSEYSDVLYDPRQHTHSSCLQEVPNADMVILLVGARFGGTAIPEALEQIAIDELVDSSSDVTALESSENMSVTQLEILKAIESSIPVFGLVDQKVMHDHLVYQKNKDKVDDITFPSIEKPESAKYIFEFINYLRQRAEGNNLVAFSSVEDIENYLRKQWSGLFQRLLHEQRIKRYEEKRVNALSDKFDELKTAVLSTIEDSRAKSIAKNVIKFRRLINFLKGFNINDREVVCNKTMTFRVLMNELGIVSFRPLPENYKNGPSRLAFLKSDDTFYEMRGGERVVNKISEDWSAFSELPSSDRTTIFDALSDDGGFPLVHYRNVSYNEFFKENELEEESLDEFLKNIIEEAKQDKTGLD